ncbi:MAG TPA: hypothetical protein VFO14_21705, partial [Vicinamibacterales bacterium]|nr:hypothetical protein [Vicinamibacterales bacterium]
WRRMICCIGSSAMPAFRASVLAISPNGNGRSTRLSHGVIDYWPRTSSACFAVSARCPHDFR